MYDHLATSLETEDRTVTKVTGADLHLDLRGPGLKNGLVNALRDAIRSGRLAPGAKLPSSRALGVDLGIARNTVAQAYSDLVAEGWLASRQGAATRVARRTADEASPSATLVSKPRRQYLHDLRPGQPDLSMFPRADWAKAARRAVIQAPDEAFGYGGPLGRPELRTALASYLARTRGVRAHPDRIIICSGASHGLALIIEALFRSGIRAVAVEAYSLGIHRNLLAHYGMRTVPLPLDENGALVARLDDLAEVGAVLLTPSHQFPTGAALSVDRRAAVVDWARRTGTFVIEDDYDSEFRYDKHPVGALQALASEYVVYLGTTSKSLAPGLRLGWMALPERLARLIIEIKGEHELISGVTDQLTAAEFITAGSYDRHIRAMRLRYRRRRDQLVDALIQRAPQTRITGITAGLHVLIELSAGRETDVVHSSVQQGLELSGLSEFRHPDVLAERDALVIGYGTPSTSAWPGALEALCRALT